MHVPQRSRATNAGTQGGLSSKLASRKWAGHHICAHWTRNQHQQNGMPASDGILSTATEAEV